MQKEKKRINGSFSKSVLSKDQMTKVVGGKGRGLDDAIGDGGG